jgi:hypothetical protein
MGKISTSFDISLYPKGPDFKVLSQIINSLSGDTTLLSCNLGCYGTIWKVEFNNSLLLDGSVIVGIYKNHLSGTSSFPVFCGVDIIDPPVKPVVAPTVQPLTVGTGAYNYNGGMPITVTVPLVSQGQSYHVGSGGYGGSSPANTPDLNYTRKNTSAYTVPHPTCTCGAEKCGSNQHSSYCDKVR